MEMRIHVDVGSGEAPFKLAWSLTWVGGGSMVQTSQQCGQPESLGGWPSLTPMSFLPPELLRACSWRDFALILNMHVLKYFAKLRPSHVLF